MGSFAQRPFESWSGLLHPRLFLGFGASASGSGSGSWWGLVVWAQCSGFWAVISMVSGLYP